MEKFDLETFPTSESAKKMLSYVSDGFYDKSYVGKWLFQVMGLEYDKALEIVEDLPVQFFPETATWGLMYHEIKWGLPVREHLSYEERRKLIYQKRDFRTPITPYRMELYLRDATGFEVHIADVSDLGDYGFVAPHPNVFKAYFIGEGSLNSKLVREILDRLKQSHTTYTINDRIEIEVDNRKLEQFILKNIRFWMAVPFWYDYVFDGSWLLDGSVILNQKRRYGLVLGLKYKQGGFSTPEQIRLISVKLEALIRNINSLHSRAVYSFDINFWKIFRFDGLWNLDGSIELDQKWKYYLSMGIEHGLKMESDSEDVRLHDFSTRWKQHLQENAGSKAKYYFDAGLKCMEKAALTFRSELDMSERETVANVTVETRSRDYWFLNGDLSLDGTRNLDSIFKKEAIE